MNSGARVVLALVERKKRDKMRERERKRKREREKERRRDEKRKQMYTGSIYIHWYICSIVFLL